MSVPHDSVHGRPAIDHGGLHALDWLAMVLMILGGLNWGLVGATGFDLMATLLGEMTLASRAVYLLVGLAALYGIYLLTKMARHRVA